MSTEINGDSLDMDALREISAEDYAEEFPEAAEPPTPGKARIAEDDDEAQEYDDEEPTLEDEKEPADGKDDKADGEDDEKDDEEEDEGADDKDVDQSADGAADPDDALVAVGADGKQVKIPKDALLKVVVDGTEVEMTAQELYNKASGATNIERQSSEIGRQKAALTAREREIEEDVRTAQENAQLMYDLATTGSPEEFVQFYGQLTGKDPVETLQGIVKSALEYAQKFDGMSDTEIKLHMENMRFRFNEKVDKRSRAQQDEQRQIQQMETETEQLLARDGLTWDDFNDAVGHLKKMQAAGHDIGNLSHQQVVQHAAVVRHENKVKKAVAAIDKAVLSDPHKLSEIASALWQDETLIRRRRTTDAEAVEFVKRALGRTGNDQSESLSRKVDRAARATGTKSKPASSQRRREDREPVTLAEHRRRMEQMADEEEDD